MRIEVVHFEIEGCGVYNTRTSNVDSQLLPVATLSLSSLAMEFCCIGVITRIRAPQVCHLTANSATEFLGAKD